MPAEKQWAGLWFVAVELAKLVACIVMLVGLILSAGLLWLPRRIMRRLSRSVSRTTPAGGGG